MAFVNNEYSTKINIDLENGLYTFNNMSATGKTRLYKVLKALQLAGEPVAAYSFEDYKYGVDLKAFLEKNRNKCVLLIDRYDMFDGMYRKEIAEYSDASIVLVDYKGKLSFTDNDGLCFIQMTSNSITVEE